MKRSWLLALAAMGAIVLVAGVFLSQAPRSPPGRAVLEGSLFVSDAGRSHGGFEYTAQWNATLTVEGTSGSLRLVLNVGLGDALETHEYSVTDFTRAPSRVSMSIEGRPLVLIWVENDAVWNRRYDRHYIASWGGEAPPDEIRGTISPAYFPGLRDFWYVELRLR